EGFSHFVTSMAAPVASGWSGWPGGTRTHWKAPPFHGAHPTQTFAAGPTRRLHPCPPHWNTSLSVTVSPGSRCKEFREEPAQQPDSGRPKHSSAQQGGRRSSSQPQTKPFWIRES